MDIGVAILGCGRMGRQRARAALSLGARVAAVYDPDAQRAYEVGALAGGCTVLRDWQDLDLGSIDAVFVCTPPNARGPAELRALEAGVPLFVEKPVGLSAAHCAATHEALERRPAITAVGYMNRYRPSVQAARDALAGKVVLGLSCNWAGTRYAVPWWDHEPLSGGPINEQATHLVDLARYLAGDIREVHAMADGQRGPHGAPEAAAVTLRFDGGALGRCSTPAVRARRRSVSRWSPRMLGCGSTAGIFGCGARTAGSFPRRSRSGTRSSSFEVAAFFDAIRKDSTTPILSDLSDALRTQRVVDAIRRSLVSHRPEPAD